MDTMILEVQSRDKSLKAKDLLAANLIPIEFYGKGVENQSLQVDYQTFRRLFRATGTNMIIELSVDGGKSKMNVLVHDVDYHPATDSITHVDLINVRMGELIHTKIPLELVGVAPAVKELGGTLMSHLTELDVKCLPKDLIHSIEVDVESIIDFHTFIRVKDLVVPSTLEVLSEAEDVVVAAVAPRVEEEATESAEGDAPAEAGESPAADAAKAE